MKTKSPNLLVTLLVLILSVFITSETFAQPAVNISTPLQNAVNVTANANINIGFNETMDATSINSNSIIVYGSYRGVYSGLVTYSGTTAVFNPDVDFLPGEVITTTVTTGAQSAGSVPLSRSYTFSFTVAAQGDGLFQPEVTFAAVPTSQATDVVAADLNGDGNIDLAVLSQGDNSISVHFSNGDGTFATPVVLATANIPMRLIAADVNGSGSPDLLVANASAQSLSLFINNGNQTFGARSDFGTSGTLAAADMVVMDLTGNGHLDVVQLHLGSPNPSNNLFLFSNDGLGNFGTGFQYSIADLSGGGSLAVSNHNGANSNQSWRTHLLVTDFAANQMRVYENTGAGDSFAFAQTRFAGTGPVAATALNLTGTSGQLDAVVANRDSDNLTVYLASGGTAFNSQSNYGVGGEPYFVQGGDMNGNGSIDLVAVKGTGNRVSILSNSSGTFFTNTELSLSANPNHVVLADLNGSGKLDIITANTNGTVSILYNYPGPAITSVSPANNATGVGSYDDIVIDFSVDFMDPATMNATNIQVLDGGGAVIPASFNFAGSTLTITPNAPFQQGTSVSVTVSADVKSTTGLSIINPTSFSFGVAESFANIVSVSPAANAFFDPALESVSIVFSDDMKLASIENGVKVIGSARGAYSGSWGFNSATNTATFTPTLNFIAGESISVIVGTSVETTIGGLLAEQFQRSFVIDAAGGGAFVQGDAIGTSILSPLVVKVADMNGDGNVDIVAINATEVSVSLNDGFGGYQTPITTALGANNATNFTVADFDGDGNADIAVVHTSNTNLVSFLFGDGLGGFSAPVTYTVTEAYLDFLAAGDLNGNGLIDLAVTLYSSSQVVILQNNGDRTFTQQTPITSGGGAWDVLIVDVNNDGHLDIVTGDYDAGTISVLMNNGDGTFAAKVSYAAGQYVSFMAAGDVNGDGFIDIVADNYGDGNFFVMLNDGNGVFSLGSTLNASGFKLTLVKTKEAGNLDLVAVNSGNLVVFSNNGLGTFNSTPKLITVPGTLQSIVALDMDGDNEVDLVSLSNDGNAYTMLNTVPVTVVSTTPSANALNIAAASTISASFSVDMDATTLTASNIVVQSDSRGVISGTLNYNAATRTVTFTPTNSFLPGEQVSVTVTKGVKSSDNIAVETAYYFGFTVAASGNGSFVYNDALNTGSVYNSYLYAADVDGDGDGDLIGFSSGAVKVYKNNAGVFSEFSSLVVTGWPEKGIIGDFNNNGHVDVAYRRPFSASLIYFLTNDGAGNFSQAATNYIEMSTRDAITADFDNDGNLDIAWVYGAQIMYIYWGNGDFTFPGSNTFTTGPGGGGAFTLSKLSSGDINNNGQIDIVGYEDQNGTIVVMSNNGSRSFGFTTTYATPAKASDIALVDVTGDGFLDIVVTSSEGKSFSILKNNGDGTLATAVTYSTSPFALSGLKAFDFTGNGKIDLTFHGYEDFNGTDLMIIAYNDGNGGFGNQVTYEFPSDAPFNYYGFNSNYTLLDVNGNGSLDLAGRITDGTNQYIGFALNEALPGADIAPTVSASNIALDATTFNSATINWTNGNGARRFVVVREANPVNSTPVDNASYSPNPTFGSGSEIGTGNFAVFGGNGNSASIKGLNAETTYHVTIFEVNGIPGQEKFLITDAPTFSFTTADAPIIWDVNVSPVTFTKADNADWTLEANQDRITYDIWLTRKNSKGLYNTALESEYDESEYISPKGTLWAQGTTADIGSLTFTNFYTALNERIGDNIVGTNMVMHLTEHNIYIDINFSSWTTGGGGSTGGFSYTRGDGVKPTIPTVNFETVAGNALHFDGSQNSQVSIAEIQSEFTLEMWVKPEVVGTDQAIIQIGNNNMLLGINGTNNFYGIYGGNFGGATVTGTTAITAGQWYHVVLMADGGTNLKLYVNGTEEATAARTSRSYTNQTMIIGSNNASANYFTGTLDEMRFWRSVRTPSQIRANIYNPLPSVYDVGLVSYWQLNEGTGVTAADNMGDQNITVNTATWVASNSPLGTGTSVVESDVTTGTVSIGNAQLEITDAFDNPVEVVLTEVTEQPNTYPTGFTSSIGGKYFVINLYGNPGVFSLNLTLNFGEGVITAAQETDPSSLILNRRESNDTGGWTSLGGATSAFAATGAVTWSGITSFSQFIAVAEELVFDIQIPNNTNVIAYNDSTFTFDQDFFNLTGNFKNSELTISSSTTLSGALYLDQNMNGVYDAGIDSLLIEHSQFTYTPSGSVKLRYSSTNLGVESATLKLQTGSEADSVALNFYTIEGSPILAGNVGENGWYLLSNPVDSTLGMLLSNIWTQGAVNSNAPNADATIYTFNQDSAKYFAVTTDLDTTKVAAGTGLLVYIFEDDDILDGQSDVDGGWPKTLSNYGNPFGTDLNVTIKNVDSDGVTGTTGSEGFALLGNPFGWALSADSVIAKLKQEDPLANSYVYRWDAVNKVYKLSSTGAIDPYESFFVRVISSGTTANLNFEYDDADASILSKKVEDKMFEFTLNHPESGLESSTFLRFNEKAELGIDPYDGYYLGTYANSFANLYTLIGDQSLTINNLPNNESFEAEFDVFLHTSEEGEFELTWDSENLPKDLSFQLTEVSTGFSVNLKNQNTIEFNSSSRMKAKGLSSFASAIEEQASNSDKSEEPNFKLKVSSTTVNNESELGIPMEVELFQNYPNPFNPTTVIRYGVPTQSEVKLEIYDILGRKIMTLLSGDVKQPGRYNAAFDASRLSSGMYVYRLEIGNQVLTKKMTLIK